ncbi:MAG: periplasmic heavy metal sensor [Xanthomonadales bacterium]|nr:hypothetical protein [Xanthomonadales bacterium]MCC6593527.1 periplasmic heavy metal sensor [Xanthomonadales bacterium]MCE7932850.1 periplasmic heavy metal sensor [Xanthomonadales bacterium PRO6]
MNVLPRPYRYLLLLSLALNLGLGAAFATMHWQHRHGGHPEAGERRWARVPMPRHLLRVLEDPDRAILREVFERHREDLRAHYQPLGAARRELAEALRAEPFDPSAMERAFAGMRGAEGETANAMHAFMLELATRISADGRQRIARQLERHGHEHEHRGGHAPSARSERSPEAPAVAPD